MKTESKKPARSVTDMMGREVLVPAKPKRIISLVPSQTELLFDLGLGSRVVGITKFCIHPADRVKDIAKVGGTKNLDLPGIRALKPDLIIGNKEENYEEGINQLVDQYPVWMSDIETVADALLMIRQLGDVLQVSKKADKLATAIAASFGSLCKSRPAKVAYFIWRKPYMVAGGSTYISSVLSTWGLTNVFAGRPGRYPEVTPEELLKADPDIVLLSSEPFPFNDTHVMELSEILPKANILLVDGELFSWYGSRMLHTADYLNQLADKV